MAILKIIFRSALLALVALGFSGCFDASEDDSQIPWGRPADFESQGPGFGPGNTY
ncbi:MAG: hypothetical protein AAF212_00030 [Verrucomicrobiota bacterium]